MVILPAQEMGKTGTVYRISELAVSWLFEKLT
jgi:hypothetical protein